MSDVRDTERPFDGQREGAGVVLHEERLRAGVERVESGRIEVRKRVVTEEVTVTLPVRREVVDVVRVYGDGSEEAVDLPASSWQPRIEQVENLRGGARDGGPKGDGVFDAERAEREARQAGEGGVHDVVLYEERPVVATQLYAIERVRITVDGQTEVVAVQGEVRREVVDIEGVEGVDDAARVERRGEAGAPRV